MQSTWLLAQPHPGQVRAGDPIADPAFHDAMAARVCRSPVRPVSRPDTNCGDPPGRTPRPQPRARGQDRCRVLGRPGRRRDGDRRCRSATPVGHASAPRRRAGGRRAVGPRHPRARCDRSLLAHRRRVASQTTLGVTAEIAGAIARADLAPMLWVTRPGSLVHGTDDLQRIGDLLVRAAAHGADLSRLTVSSASTRRRSRGATASVRSWPICGPAIPAQVAQVLVVVPRDRLHLAQSDAYDLTPGRRAAGNTLAGGPLRRRPGSPAGRRLVARARAGPACRQPLRDHPRPARSPDRAGLRASSRVAQLTRGDRAARPTAQRSRSDLRHLAVPQALSLPSSSTPTQS